ncbi:AAA family ATPase [Rugamonas aquatica]|uniref:DNA helicase n=1 Tax=Rugamonas aquatica TaxID=2743357 RepID=A0A6A7N4K6_9BURK|nr:AAA family ATPase [Rugamonas aquatica]MQA39956.1 hypothetical protein [Rugamonas aquatica]
MQLPIFDDLVEEQLKVYEYTPAQSMLVVGPPGSGKTSMAIWRARVMVSPDLNLNVALITKNRLLSAVAGQLARENNNAGIETATMHSFVARDYSRRIGGMIPSVARFKYDWEQIFSDYEKAEIEPILDNLIIDEGQNLPIQFFHWAKRYGAKHLSVFADEHQTTENDGISIRELQHVGFRKVFPLLVNHRNTKNIATLVGCFHSDRKIPQASPKRGLGAPPSLLEVDTWEEFADLVAARFKNRREAIGVIVHFVSEVNAMQTLLKARLPETRVDAYTNKTRKGEELAIEMRVPGVTIISGESAIGLEFDALYLQDLSRSLPIVDPLQQRRLYMLCARAREMLFLVNGPTKLSKVQLESLPSPPILER